MKKSTAWKTGKTINLEGFKITLSRPVLVGRKKGCFQFPTVTKISNGDLVAVISDYSDTAVVSSTALLFWSSDEGLTWSEPVSVKDAGWSNICLPSGDQLFLPYYLHPLTGGMGSPCNIITGNRQVMRNEDGVKVTGWPRVDRRRADLSISGFSFHGQTVTLNKEGYLATLYGHFQGDTCYSLVAAESKDGFNWKMRSVIADETWELHGEEGPCESALCRLNDGRLMCIFRRNSGAMYGQTWSSDEGRTWEPAMVISNTFSVEPSLALLKGGKIVSLSGGRPGLYLWFNFDGTGRDWQGIDMLEHHNKCRPEEPISENNTTSYTEIVALDETRLLYIYDRIPCGTNGVPEDSPETNSLWVVQVMFEN